ncbi:MAG: type II secretion system protein [Rubrivivax sp.]|nr:type II secretion system protein [Rubrivivax sp.]
MAHAQPIRHAPCTGAPARAARGFTLVEMIVAIALIGLLSVMAAPLLRIPMVAWMDASRRADLGATADLVQDKLAADLARALPNSVRVRQVGTRVWLEYLEVRAQGRHRAGTTAAAPACPATCSTPGGNDMLEAACSETCFTSLGPLQGDPPLAGSDWVVVNPLGPGVPAGDPYFGGNAAVAGGIKVRLADVLPAADGSRLRHAAHTFPATAASRRFYLVATPVSYECNPATQRLLRHAGYAVAAVQPTAFAGADTVPLASNLAACSLRYTPAGALGRGGVVSMWLRLSRVAADTGAPESVEIHHQFAVSEAP